jgi:hypothetical protein
VARGAALTKISPYIIKIYACIKYIYIHLYIILNGGGKQPCVTETEKDRRREHETGVMMVG